MRWWVLGVMVVAGCVSHGAEQRGTSAGEASTHENKLFARYPLAAYRRGNVLHVASRGGVLEYRDKSCAVDADCVLFRLDDVFLDGRLFGIEVGYYEGGDYIVADTQSQHLYTGGRPIFSSSGSMFATAVFSEAYETSAEGVRLYALDLNSGRGGDTGLRLVRLISPNVLTYPDNVVWLTDACVSFVASEGSLYDAQGSETPRTSFYLVSAEPEWRLTKEREAKCTK
jgi:hypothetical protein